MPLIIYTTKDDTYLDKIKEYAKFNDWSISKAVRQILKAFVKVNFEDLPSNFVGALPDIKIETEPEKIDLATFEAQTMAKLNTNQDMEACIKDKTNDNGEVSCYFFDNAREYHPYCKEKCWTREDIWGKRVRK